VPHCSPAHRLDPTNRTGSKPHTEALELDVDGRLSSRSALMTTEDHPQDETAASRVEPRRLVASAGDTVEHVRQQLREGDRSDWELLCVIDAEGHLVGTLSAAELLVLPDAAVLGDAAHRDRPRVRSDADQEEMASMALQQGVAVMPVVDAAGQLIGVVGSVTMMDILRREHVEDLHRLAGVTRESDDARNALEEPPLRSARHRLPWLIVGLGGSVVATFIVARFETALAVKPALAFFVPGLVYLADAIGTQSEAVAVRGLSLSHIGIGRLIGNELRTGLMIGTVLALLAFPMVWLVFGEPRLAAAVALALAGASIVASVLGLALPWLLARFGSDPAYGSGPLATIVQDVLSLLIYFGFVTAIVL
jgi:magnesium transporter